MTPFLFENTLQSPPQKFQVVLFFSMKISTLKQPSNPDCAETDRHVYPLFINDFKEHMSPIRDCKLLKNIEQVQQHHMQDLNLHYSLISRAFGLKHFQDIIMADILGSFEGHNIPINHLLLSYFKN
ncbi:hypothetical protein E3N88_13923 [Mikania micrantha]|uniref:Uncharacterized protein n=1 Tax=Mikania micrantha TaxID=192012 RepID=A0A5N6P211_9ASTR|nr:hypothetical protein E3N88_13923 [Mikania micrantha]